MTSSTSFLVFFWFFFLVVYGWSRLPDLARLASIEFVVNFFLSFVLFHLIWILLRFRLAFFFCFRYLRGRCLAQGLGSFINKRTAWLTFRFGGSYWSAPSCLHFYWSAPSCLHFYWPDPAESRFPLTGPVFFSNYFFYSVSFFPSVLIEFESISLGSIWLAYRLSLAWIGFEFNFVSCSFCSLRHRYRVLRRLDVARLTRGPRLLFFFFLFDFFSFSFAFSFALFSFRFLSPSHFRSTEFYWHRFALAITHD